MVIRYSVLAAAFVALAEAACSKSHGEEPCPRNQPAFHLQVTAADGVLPEDTELSVGYEGILKEHYSLKKGGKDNVDLCCAPGEAVKGALPEIRCGATPVREASVSLSNDGSASGRAPVPPADGTASVLDASAPGAGTRNDASVPLDGAVGRATGPTAIHCSIWTDNVADIRVTATGYATYHRPFEAYVPDPRCGVETIDERITLYHGEGGL